MLDAAVARAYGDQRCIARRKVLAGEAAHAATGEWLPEATLEAIRTQLVALKGPLTTPIGGGFRSLNVTLRQQLDLFARSKSAAWLYSLLFITSLAVLHNFIWGQVSALTSLLVLGALVLYARGHRSGSVNRTTRPPSYQRPLSVVLISK